MGRKTLKGLVSIDADKNTIRLRWRYQTKRYSLNLFLFTKVNLVKAKEIAVLIEKDLVAGSFDPSLHKYRQQPVKKPCHPRSTTIEYFEEWVTQYKHMDCKRNIDYHATRNMLKRWGPFTASTVVHKLNGETFNERTFNKRLSMLKGFYTWMVKYHQLAFNPFELVEPKKVRTTPKPQRKPFSQEEIEKILQAFKADTYLPKGCRYPHSNYYPFVYFIFKTGVRNAEAIGLRVAHIDLVNSRIKISEVLARSIQGTHASARVRKETKNGKVRYLPLDEDLKAVIEPLLKNKDRDAFVFQSPNGTCVDDRMFQRRVFKPILQALGIENRVLYACRHTFGSRCIESGISPVMTAFLMGNNPETALRNYIHQLSLPASLPLL